MTFNDLKWTFANWRSCHKISPNWSSMQWYKTKIIQNLLGICIPQFLPHLNESKIASRWIGEYCLEKLQTCQPVSFWSIYWQACFWPRFCLLLTLKGMALLLVTPGKLWDVGWCLYALPPHPHLFSNAHQITGVYFSWSRRERSQFKGDLFIWNWHTCSIEWLGKVISHFQLHYSKYYLAFPIDDFRNFNIIYIAPQNKIKSCQPIGVVMQGGKSMKKLL